MSVRFTGLTELKAALRALPQELAGEARGLVRQAALNAMHDAASHYPYRSGRLRGGLQVEVDTPSAVGARARLINRTTYAKDFELGTGPRHIKTGANRGAVRTPGRVFYPAVRRAKDAMYQALVDMLQAHGLTVERRG